MKVIEAHALLESYTLGAMHLKNRVVMAPMTRSRAIGNIPNLLMVEYYEQRAGAGLIITEGTAPSPNGLGYPRIPGIFLESQVDAWRKVTEAVHKHDAKIVVQLMHTGRISHPLNMPFSAHILAPSLVQATGKMWTDAEGLQEYPMPHAMDIHDILDTKNEFITAALDAVSADFDGVELHAANGYLLEQFLSPHTNLRTDSYGGSIQNRCRFVIEVAAAVSRVIGKDRLGIRLSPYGVANDMPLYPEIDATYKYLAEQLNYLGIAYIHLVDHSSMGTPQVPLALKKSIRASFTNTIILSGGYNKTTAEADIQSGLGNLVAFGRPFINNPDFVERVKNDWDMATELHDNLFYTSDSNGYTDYPNHKYNI